MLVHAYVYLYTFSGYHAVNSETPIPRAYVERSRGCLPADRVVHVPSSYWWLLGLWKPGKGEQRFCLFEYSDSSNFLCSGDTVHMLAPFTVLKISLL